MSKSIKISADFIQEMKSACTTEQLPILKNSVDAWECTITQEGLIQLYGMACTNWKEKFEIKFPEIIKNNNPCKDINGIDDIYKKLSCDPKNDIVKIDQFDEGQINCVINFIKNMRVKEAYNGKKKLPLTSKRWYNWYKVLSSGAGLDFDDSYYYDDFAFLSSGARLSFEKQEYLDDARKKFPELDIDLISK